MRDVGWARADAVADASQRQQLSGAGGPELLDVLALLKVNIGSSPPPLPPPPPLPSLRIIPPP